MSSESNPERHLASYDDVNTRSLFLVGLISAILVFVAIVAVQTVYYRYEQSEFQRKIIDSSDNTAEEIIAAQKGRLTAAGAGANPEAKEQAVPISKAMATVLADYRARQDTAAVAGRTPAEAQAEQAISTPSGKQLASEK